MNRTTATRAMLPAALVLGSLAVAAGPAAHAAPSKKQFTVTLTVTDPVAGSSSGLSTGTLLADHTYTFVFTITNKSRPQTFGSAQILVPTGYTLVSVQPETSVDGFTARESDSVGTGAGAILLTSDSTSSGIPAGGAVDITASVTTPSVSCDAEWTTLVKQSNDFLGTGNDFTLSGSQPTTTVGAGSLSWSTQPPAVTEFDQDMAPAPQVTALDPCGLTDTGFTGTVTLSDAFADTEAYDSSAADPATAPAPAATAVGGVATFADLRFHHYGLNDRLTAAAPGYTSATSQWVVVAQVVQPCRSTASCPPVSLAGTQTSALVETGPGQRDDYVSGSVVDGTGFSECAAQKGSGAEQVGQTVVVDSPRTKTVTITIPKDVVNLVPNNGTPFYDVCLDIPEEQQTADNGFVDSSGATVYEGLLPDCVLATDVGPCVVSRTKKAGAELISFVLPAGDPRSSVY